MNLAEVPSIEVSDRATRRRFTAEYKRRIPGLWASTRLWRRNRSRAGKRARRRAGLGPHDPLEIRAFENLIRRRRARTG